MGNEVGPVDFDEVMLIGGLHGVSKTMENISQRIHVRLPEGAD
ncbi:MAG: hypothetical protein ACOCY7_04270 [Halodesulfurarchaeum sp.]